MKIISFKCYYNITEVLCSYNVPPLSHNTQAMQDHLSAIQYP